MAYVCPMSFLVLYTNAGLTEDGFEQHYQVCGVLVHNTLTLPDGRNRYLCLPIHLAPMRGNWNVSLCFPYTKCIDGCTMFCLVLKGLV